MTLKEKKTLKQKKVKDQGKMNCLLDTVDEELSSAI